jgi:hypothetical protein
MVATYATVRCAGVDTAMVTAGSSYSGIATATGASTAKTVTDVVSLEAGNRAHGTVTPVSVPSGPGMVNPLELALGWRVAPTG